MKNESSRTAGPSRRSALWPVSRALLAACMVFLPTTTSRAQQADDPPADAPQWISGLLVLEGTYDDNFMEYSPRDLNELANGIRPTKYVVTSADDAIGSMRARLDLTPPLGDLDFRTRLRLRFTGDWYRTNSVKDHRTWGVELTQRIFGVNYISLRFIRVPDYYLRNLYYKRYQIPSRAPSHYDRAVVERTDFGLELGRRMSPSLRLAVKYGYDWGTYPTLFEERDNSLHAVRIETDYRLTRSVRLSLDYMYAIRWARGRDNFSDPAYDSLADISSQYNRLEARVSWDMRRAVALPLTTQTGVAYERQGYLSGKPGDIYHYGRRDDYWKFAAELDYDFPSGIGIFVHYIWEENRTNLGETGDAGNYQVHIVGTGVAFSF